MVNILDMANICPRCMANMDVVGKAHRCVTRSSGNVFADLGLPNSDVLLAEAQAFVSKAYKYRDPVKRRAYMKEYMRKRRKRGPTL